MNRASLRTALRVVLGLGGVALAGKVQGGILAPAPNLPAPGVYRMAPGDFLDYNLPGWGNVRISGVDHQPLAEPPVLVNPIPPDEEEIFHSLAWMLVAVDFDFDSNFDLFANLTMSGQTRVLLRDYPGPNLALTGTFSTEMLAMELTGNTPFGPVMIRESPTLPSVGQTTVSEVGGGQYQIDSFFDIFTELSLDGGEHWIPQSTPGPKRMTLPDAASTAGMLVLALGTLLAAARRSRATHPDRRQERPGADAARVRSTASHRPTPSTINPNQP